MHMVNKKSGFTLIEIIIVVVILGILAAVALPKITQNIGKAVASEAFQVGAAFGRAMDRCLAEQSAGAAVDAAMAGACDTFAEVNITNPAGALPANFASFTPVLAFPTLTLTAVPNVKNGITAADTVVFTYNVSTGAITKACNGLLANMCK